MAHTGMNLELYKQQVGRFASTRDGSLFMNAGAGYAKIVVNALFENAKKSLHIYSGGLSKEIYNRGMFEALIDGKGIARDDIRIVLSNQNSDDHNTELLTELSELGLNLRIFDETGGHIAIADNSMYRFEYDHDKKLAMCAFGSTESPPSKIDLFTSTFGSIWDNAKAYPSLTATS